MPYLAANAFIRKPSPVKPRSIKNTEHTMSQAVSKPIWVKVLFWIALIFSWLSLIFFIPLQLGIPLWLIALIILFVRKSKLKWYLLVFSAWPILPVYSFLKGTVQYATGHATMQYVGYPNSEFYNLDRELRTWNSTSGCIYSGIEPITQYPNNAAVRLCTSLFGVQSGVYRGQYPEKDQALAMIQTQGQTVSFKESGHNISFPIGTQTITLHDVYPLTNQDLPLPDSCRTATAAVVNNELVLFIPNTCHTSKLYLAEYTTGKVFARYWLPGKTKD